MKPIRETSMQIASKLIQLSSLRNNLTILEPSAGTGNIIDCLVKEYAFENLSIDCVELNKEKFTELKSKGYNAFNADFLQWEPGKYYDRIIACPPFKGNVDLKHIQKMFSHLDEKGTLITLTSPLWITNNDTHQIEFRNWLSDKDYSMQMLPDNSFMEKGKSVPTMILKLKKNSYETI